MFDIGGTAFSCERELCFYFVGQNIQPLSHIMTKDSCVSPFHNPLALLHALTLLTAYSLGKS